MKAAYRGVVRRPHFSTEGTICRANDNVTKLTQPGSFEDPLTEVLRNGARALLAQAVEAEVAEFLAKHADLKTDDGRVRVVRHGHLPEREVMTGIGPVAVRQPRVRDRGVAADDAGRIRFTPAIPPPYARPSRSLEVLILQLRFFERTTLALNPLGSCIHTRWSSRQFPLSFASPMRAAASRPSRAHGRALAWENADPRGRRQTLDGRSFERRPRYG